jgi:hypothetical protein
MAVVGSIIKKGLFLTSKIKKIRKTKPTKWQRKTLQKLLKKAKNTEFGLKYNFESLVSFQGFKRKNELYEAFKSSVPIHDYEKMYSQWWSRTHKGYKNVTWPGKVKYFALSSGTSTASSKAIPVTKEMLKSIHKSSIAQIVALGQYRDLPNESFEKGYLLLGGSTKLNSIDDHLEGDLSGITIRNMPFWFERFFKPGKEISQEKIWEKKLNIITTKAAEWDISFVAGVPAWIQMLFERMIAHYKVENIHEIWPNLVAFGWGGVSIDPYKEGFSKLLDPAKPFHYLETYLASEGFIAFQASPEGHLKMILDQGIFYEFIPFSSENFDEDGNLKPEPKTLMINEVQEDVQYALLLSTCAGAWRYLIGDTIKFVNVANAEIVITGRTKHFLSLCGEHLSVENMTKAILEVSTEKKLNIKEFTVIGKKYNSNFEHLWYIGCDQAVDEKMLGEWIDEKVRILNDDYAVERLHALEKVSCKVLPSKVFMDWMKKRGKLGGQNKFPRVLKGQMALEWEDFIR